MRLFITILFCLSYYSYSQTDTIYFNSEWEVVSEPIDATYYRLLEKQDKLWKVNDYFIDGQIQMSGFFSDLKNETREKTFMFYDKDGQKTEVTNYQNNMKHGKYESYFQNGNLEISQIWNDGVKEGEVIGYYESGEVLFRGQYLNNEKKGVWRFYDTFGKVTSERIYEKNVNIAGVNIIFTMANDLWYSLDSQEQSEKMYLLFARDDLLDSNNNFANPILTVVLEKYESNKNLLGFAIQKIKEYNFKIVEDISNQVNLSASNAFQIEYLNEKKIKVLGYVIFYKKNGFIASIYLETAYSVFNIVNDEFLEIIKSIRAN